MASAALIAPPGWLTHTQLARQAGCSAQLVDTWAARYGWPMPGRRRPCVRLYRSEICEQLRRALALVRAGTPPSELIIHGRLMLPGSPAPAAPKVDLDFGEIPCPTHRDAQDIRDRLILGLIQRHPGIVRESVAQCARLHPGDRGPAVLAILAAYRSQVADHAWIDDVLET